MIDPDHLYLHARTNDELEELLLFCISAAGKNGHTAARTLERFLQNLIVLTPGVSASPFARIRRIVELHPANHLKFLAGRLCIAGVGCYNQRARSFKAAAFSQLDLARCSLPDLETLPGVSFKTSRLFALYSREHAYCLPIDRHIVQWLNDNPPAAQWVFEHTAKFYTKPPTSKKDYYAVEQALLEWVEAELKMAPREFDEFVWRSYRSKPQTCP